MSTSKMAACGIDCNECALYKVTKENDLKAAKALVPWFRSQGWIGEKEDIEAVMKKVPLCNGCWDITDDCFWSCGCGRIDFRICCDGRQINHCGKCDDFPCDHYIKWVDWGEHHKKAMEHLLSIKTNL